MVNELRADRVHASFYFVHRNYMSNEPKTVFGQKVVVRNAKEKKALIMKRSDYKNASGNAQDKKDSETRDMI